MRRPRIIHAQRREDLQRRRQQGVFVRVKRLVLLGQQMIDLARGNVDAEVEQLLENSALRHMSRVMLLQHEDAQAGAEVPLNSGGQFAANEFACRRPPSLQQIAGVACFDDQVLHHVGIASHQRGTAWQILGRKRNFLVNRQILSLRSFFRTGPFAVRGRDGRRLAERTGFAVGRGLLRTALEIRDFRFERREALCLLCDHLQQKTHEGRLLFVPKIGDNLLPISLWRRLLIALTSLSANAHGPSLEKPPPISCASLADSFDFHRVGIDQRLYIKHELLRTNPKTATRFGFMRLIKAIL